MKNYIAETLKRNYTFSKYLIIYMINIFLLNFWKFFNSFCIEMRNLSIILYLCFSYFFSSIILQYYLDEPIQTGLWFYYREFYEYSVVFLLVSIHILILINLIRYFSSGFSGLSTIFYKFKRNFFDYSKISSYILIISSVPLFIYSYTIIKQNIPKLHIYSTDQTLFNIDRYLHFNNTPWEIIQPIVGHPEITRFIDYCYLAWGALFVYSLLYMACHNDKQLRIQFFISLACCWILIGNILAILLSSAGPCYFSEVTGASVNPYKPLFDYLHSIPQLKCIGIQKYLWKASQSHLFMPFGGISAMPSMHVSIAVLLALLHRRLFRLLGWVMIGFAMIIQIGSVHLGWHYAVDGYLGALLTVGIWKGVGTLYKRKENQREELLL